jgi:hypothetical protein
VPGLTQEQRDTIYGLFDAHVDAGLAWVRKQDSEYIPSVDNNLTTSLTMIMQVCCNLFTCIICVTPGSSCSGPCHHFPACPDSLSSSKARNVCLAGHS